MENPEKFKIIFQKYLENKCSPEEVDWLLAYLKSNEQHKLSQQLIEQQISSELTKNRVGDPELHERLEMRLQKIREMIAEERKTPVISIHQADVRRLRWSRIAAAAIIVLVIGAGAYLFLNHKPEEKEIAKINVPIKNDVAAPSSTHALIILANGKQIELDSAGNGSLAMQGNVNIQKLADGQIAYKGNSDETVYNTLLNPRGSKVINITLNDGSKVWLNAESSLRFPASFTGDERKVTITGEAYFEVAHNQKSPFIVDVNGTEIKVLGTHFNINAYNDESNIKTTLLEGSVEVSVPFQRDGVRLKPGQQAIKTGDGKLTVNNYVAVNEVMAWRNGLFNFNNADIITVMRQLERWYNIKVSYEGKTPDILFKGEMYRNVNLSNVLEFLKESGLRFRRDDRTLIIL